MPQPIQNPFSVSSGVVGNASQQQAASSASPQQAARWLMGRIKDGSQRCLLMQQASGMALSMRGAPTSNVGDPLSTSTTSSVPRVAPLQAGNARPTDSQHKPRSSPSQASPNSAFALHASQSPSVPWSSQTTRQCLSGPQKRTWGAPSPSHVGNLNPTQQGPGPRAGFANALSVEQNSTQANITGGAKANMGLPQLPQAVSGRHTITQMHSAEPRTGDEWQQSGQGGSGGNQHLHGGCMPGVQGDWGRSSREARPAEAVFKGGLVIRTALPPHWRQEQQHRPQQHYEQQQGLSVPRSHPDSHHSRPCGNRREAPPPGPAPARGQYERRGYQCEQSAYYSVGDGGRDVVEGGACSGVRRKEADAQQIHRDSTQAATGHVSAVSRPPSQTAPYLQHSQQQPYQQHNQMQLSRLPQPAAQCTQLGQIGEPWKQHNHMVQPVMQLKQREPCMAHKQIDPWKEREQPQPYQNMVKLYQQQGQQQPGKQENKREPWRQQSYARLPSHQGLVHNTASAGPLSSRSVPGFSPPNTDNLNQQQTRVKHADVLPHYRYSLDSGSWGGYPCSNIAKAECSSASLLTDYSNQSEVSAQPKSYANTCTDACDKWASLLPRHGALFGKLSAEQRMVVDAPPESSVCVLAGPGAGKTTTITARIVRLLVEGMRPVVALTFTKKGANELERRVRGGLQSVLSDSNLSGTSKCEISDNDLFVGTFHSFFVRLLRSHGAPLGVPATFRVLGQFPQLTLLRTLIEQEKREEAARRLVGKQGVSAALRTNPGDPKDSSEEVEDLSENEKENGDSEFHLGGGRGGGFASTSREAEELRRRIRGMKFIPELLNQERAAGSVLYRLFCQYTRHLKAHQPPLFDFTDLTVLAIKLLERDDVRAELRTLWPYLVVDEFQDTNRNQFKFLRLLALRKPPQPGASTTSEQQLVQSAHGVSDDGSSADANGKGGITVVGDDDQSIYKWRGTHTGIFQEFRQTFPNYREFCLACNYRSVPLVVRHSLSLVRFNWPFRIGKALYSSQETRSRLRTDARKQKHDTPQQELNPKSQQLQPMHVAEASQKSEEKLCRESPEPMGDVRGAFLPSQSLEAQYILRYILSLKQHHNLRWDDFAILCRTNSALMDLQRLLMDPRIQRAACAPSPLFSVKSLPGTPDSASGVGDPNLPLDPASLFPSVDITSFSVPSGGLPMSSTISKRAGGAEIFLRPDAVDLLCYLRLAVDPHHDSSFIRVLNRPPRKIGAKTLLMLKRVQRSLAGHANAEAEERRAPELPWQQLPWDSHGGSLGAPATASLFRALCVVLHSAGCEVDTGDDDLSDNMLTDARGPCSPMGGNTHQSVDAEYVAEAAALRRTNIEALSSFATAISSLRTKSRTSASVSEMLEYVLGPLRLGSFIAERRQAQRARAGASSANDEGSAEAGAGIPSTAPGEKPKPTRRKRKAGCTDATETAGKNMGIWQEHLQGGESLRELSRVYGSEVFADVLGLLRAVEAYAPNWQQGTATDCVMRLLRDAGSGRFVQQKANNAITLSTIHQAKGLEWQAVIVARANDGTLPMALGGSQPLADFVARVVLGFAEKEPTPEAQRRAEEAIMRQAAGNEQHLHLMEERRVCYVALTRAKQFLLLTAPLADKSNHPLQPSRFFREACLVKQPLTQLPVKPAQNSAPAELSVLDEGEHSQENVESGS